MHKSTMTFIIEWKGRRGKMHDAIRVIVAFVDRFLRIAMEIRWKFLQETTCSQKEKLADFKFRFKSYLMIASLQISHHSPAHTVFI